MVLRIVLGNKRFSAVLGQTWKFADVRKTSDGMRSRRNPKSSIPSGGFCGRSRAQLCADDVQTTGVTCQSAKTGQCLTPASFSDESLREY